MYGVVGKGTAPKSVIEASLEDLGKDETFVIPWYGKVTPGLEVVYDWVLDNEVQFQIEALEGARPAPKALQTAALKVKESVDVDAAVIHTLAASHGGSTLVMWDEADEEASVDIASLSIAQGLPTFELTNGMVPIIFSDSAPEQPPAPPAPATQPEEDTSFDRLTLENMPAAVVKRMAKEKGFDAKTREDAIAWLVGDEPGDDTPDDATEEKTIVSVVITFSDGTVVRY